MNCKPGDLAVLVRMLSAQDLPYLGKPLTCVRLAEDATFTWGEPFWEVAELPPAYAVRDSCLRPIRDPGDDAVDESKQWLPPVPQTDTLSEREVARA